MKIWDKSCLEKEHLKKKIEKHELKNCLFTLKKI